MQLVQWMNTHDIDPEKGLAMTLTTTHFSPNKGVVAGVSLAPLWGEEVTNLWARGASEEGIASVTKYTGLTYEYYGTRAKRVEQVVDELQELVDEAHWIVAYNVKGFFKKWYQSEVLFPVIDMPVLDICTYVCAHESGWNPGTFPKGTVYELQDELTEEFGSFRKTDHGSTSFDNVCSRYIPDSVRCEMSDNCLQGETNVRNLKELTQRALLL